MKKNKQSLIPNNPLNMWDELLPTSVPTEQPTELPTDKLTVRPTEPVTDVPTELLERALVQQELKDRRIEFLTTKTQQERLTKLSLRMNISQGEIIRKAIDYLLAALEREQK